MNCKPILFLVVLVVCVNLAQAAITDKTIVHWSFDNTTMVATQAKDYFERNNLTATGSPLVNQTGFIGQSITTSATAYYCVNLVAPLQTVGNNATINFWWKPGSDSAGNLFSISEVAWGNNVYNFEAYVSPYNKYGGNTRNGGVWSSVGIASSPDYAWANGNGWTMITLTMNSGATNLSTYRNATLMNQSIGAFTGAVFSVGTEQFCINNNPDGTRTTNSFDEFTIWNRTLTTSEIATLYSNGKNGISMKSLLSPDPTNFSLTAKDILSATSINTFNVSITNIGFFNTLSGSITTNISSTNNTLFNITVKSPGYYDVTYNNVNVSSNLQANLTGIPPTPPTITAPGAGNVSTYLQINYSAASTPKPQSSISFYNITLRNSDKSFNQTIISNNSVNLGYLYDTVAGSVGIGSYYIQVTAQDSDGLKAAGNSSLINVIYDSRINITVYNVSASALINIYNITSTTTNYSTTNGSVSFDVVAGVYRLTAISADSNLEILTYNVTASGQTNFKFNLSKFWASSAIFTTPVFEKSSSLIAARTNFTTQTQSQITGYSVILVYNGTTYTPNYYNFSSYHIYNATVTTPGTHTNTNATIVWYINYTRTVGGIDYITTTTLSAVQLIHPIGLDNCSSYATEAVRFNLLNETSGALVNGTLSGHFWLWIASESNYKEFNITWPTNTTFGLCINDATASYIASAQFVYGASGFSSKTYYFINATLDSTLDTIPLYLRDGTTQITLTVVDQDDIGLKSAYVYVKKYDLATASSTTSEILKTDTDGNAMAQVVLNTQRYVFVVVYNNKIVFESTPVILTASTYKIRVNLIDNFFTAYNKILNVNCHLTWNNATRKYSYTWVDTSGMVTRGCLDILKVTGTTSRTVNSSCVSSASGSIELIIATPTGIPSYAPHGTVTIDSVNYACGNMTSVSYDARYETYGLSGVFWSLFIIIFMAMVGMWSPVAAVFMSMVGLVVVCLLGIYSMSWTWLVSILIVGGIAIYKLSAR